MKNRGLFRVALAAGVAFALLGCESEIQHGLSEKDANEIRVVLSQQNIPSQKRLDESSGEGATWSILVPKGEVNRATEILVANHLPPDHQAGLAQTYAQPSMVPTETEQKARFMGALQGELAQTLESIDGVLSARVDVNIPEQNDLEDPNKRPPTSAAVVVTYRRTVDAQGNLSDKPPISEDKIKALVARAIPDLQPSNVEVALTPATLPGGSATGESYVDIAGLRMAADSVMTFKEMAAAAIVAILLLAVWIAMLYMKQSAPPRPAARSRPAAE